MGQETLQYGERKRPGARSRGLLIEPRVAYAPRTVPKVAHAPCTLPPSEYYLQSELNIPRAEGLRRSSEGGVRPVAHRPVQVHSVEEVVDFRSEEEVCAFLAEEPGNLGLLRDDEICFGVARTREGVATHVPDLPKRWCGEIFLLEDTIGGHVVRPFKSAHGIAESRRIQRVAGAPVGVEITSALEGLAAENREGRP